MVSGGLPQIAVSSPPWERTIQLEAEGISTRQQKWWVLILLPIIPTRVTLIRTDITYPYLKF
jgi:hypothetical protein